MSSSASPDIVTNGLVLCLDATTKKSYPGSGTTWFDRSGNGNNFTLMNTPTFEDAQASGLRFNPSQLEYATLNITNINNLKIQNFLANNHAISVWFNLSTQSPTMTDGTESHQALIIWPGNHCGITVNSSSLTWGLWNSTMNATINGTCPFLFSTNLWYNATVIYDKSTSPNKVLFYINGSFINSSDVTSIVSMASASGNPPNIINIGAARADSNYKWFINNGKIGSVSLYNRALTTQEIKQNFNATKSKFGLL